MNLRSLIVPCQLFYALASAAVIISPPSLRAETPSSGSALTKALSGVDWKKLSQGIPDEPDFQNSVRTVFSALTPEAQRKVTDAIKGLKEGKGPVVTETPVDGFVGKKLAKQLMPLVADPNMKDLLAAFEENGNLRELLDALTGSKSAVAAEPGSASKTGAPATSSADSLVQVEQRWFVGKTWASDAGTKWTFNRNGSGEKTFGKTKAAFSWRILPSGLVEISGRDTPTAAPRVWVVMFKSKTEALYGNTDKSLPNRMHPEK